MALVVEYHEELEYDLLTLPGSGVDLLDLWRGRLSFRRLLLLVKGLPHKSSHFVAAAAPDAAAVAQWTPTDYVLADLFDISAVGHRLQDQRRRKLPPYIRPGDAIAARVRAEAKSDGLIRQRERQAAREAERRANRGDGE